MTEAENGRNEKCKQGRHEYDLCGGECGSRQGAEAKRGRDQGNDKKGDRPANHGVLLTLVAAAAKLKSIWHVPIGGPQPRRAGVPQKRVRRRWERCRPRGVQSALQLEPRKTHMPRDAHSKAAEHHENAAKTHRTAAEHHGKGDHAKGREESTKAQGHSKTARESSEMAHAKSQSQK